MPITCSNFQFRFRVSEQPRSSSTHRTGTESARRQLGVDIFRIGGGHYNVLRVLKSLSTTLHATRDHLRSRPDETLALTSHVCNVVQRPRPRVERKCVAARALHDRARAHARARPASQQEGARLVHAKPPPPPSARAAHSSISRGCGRRMWRMVAPSSVGLKGASAP